MVRKKPQAVQRTHFGCHSYAYEKMSTLLCECPVSVQGTFESSDRYAMIYISDDIVFFIVFPPSYYFKHYEEI